MSIEKLSKYWRFTEAERWTTNGYLYQYWYLFIETYRGIQLCIYYTKDEILCNTLITYLNKTLTTKLFIKVCGRQGRADLLVSLSDRG